MGKDGRIDSKFLHPCPGYGGSCFPKDTRAIAAIARKNDSPLSIVETTIAANEIQKSRMLDKIEQGIGGTGSLSKKPLLYWGLPIRIIQVI
jgi:UDPglucose 6-dehydrogenase